MSFTVSVILRNDFTTYQKNVFLWWFFGFTFYIETLGQYWIYFDEVTPCLNSNHKPLTTSTGNFRGASDLSQHPLESFSKAQRNQNADFLLRGPEPETISINMEGCAWTEHVSPRCIRWNPHPKVTVLGGGAFGRCKVMGGGDHKWDQRPHQRNPKS